MPKNQYESTRCAIDVEIARMHELRAHQEIGRLSRAGADAEIIEHANFEARLATLERKRADVDFAEAVGAEI